MKSTHQREIYTFVKRIARRLHATTFIERLLVVLIVWLTALLLGTGLLPLASTQPLLVTCFTVLVWVCHGSGADLAGDRVFAALLPRVRRTLC